MKTGKYYQCRWDGTGIWILPCEENTENEGATCAQKLVIVHCEFCAFLDCCSELKKR